MAKERTVVKGIVLRESDSKESDKILTVLTGEMGKITVVAKGARSRRSKVSAATQFLTYSEMVLSESHGWQYLTEANTIELFDGVRSDIELLSLASYFAELVEFVSNDEAEAQALLSLFLNSLYALGTLHRPQELVKAAFEMRLMAEIGFAPLFDQCSCGIVEPAEPLFLLEEGVLLCRTCAEGLRAPALTLGALRAMRHALYADAKRLYSFSLSSTDQACFGALSEAYVRTTLERKFHTLDFYKQLTQQMTRHFPTT